MKKIVSFVLSLSMIIILIPLGCITAYADSIPYVYIGSDACFYNEDAYLSEHTMYAYVSGGAVEYTSDAAIESNVDIGWLLQRVSEGGIVSYKLAVLTDCALTSPVSFTEHGASVLIEIRNDSVFNIDTSDSACVDCDGALTIYGGFFNLKSSKGGINASGSAVINCNMEIEIDASLENNVLGINSNGTITINDGHLSIVAIASECAYGLDAGEGIEINGGSLEMNIVSSGESVGMKTPKDISILGGIMDCFVSGSSCAYGLNVGNTVSISGGDNTFETNAYNSGNGWSVAISSKYIVVEDGSVKAKSLGDMQMEMLALDRGCPSILTIGSVSLPAKYPEMALVNDSILSILIEKSNGLITGAAIGKIADDKFLVIAFDHPSPIVSYYTPTYYNINIAEDMVNGSLSSNYRSAYHGQTVTLTASPERGMCVETITVTDRNGKEIAVDNAGKNKFTFSMPGSAVTAAATFMEDNTMLNFCVDVTARDDYYDAVLWAYENNITNGTDFVHFSPFAEVSRGQAVTWLWRAAGSPEPSTLSAFSDVVPGSYCEKAAAWALEKGITNGTGGTAFSPEKICTRAEIITFLARYAGVKDAAVDTGFDDVAADSFCAAAVKWAKTNKVTDGTSENLFSPLLTCTRWQSVTFLYRYLVK